MRPLLLGTAVIVHLLSIAAVSETTSFGCKNSLISDDWRQAILDYHNKQRKMVALGQQLTAGNKPMPAAKDMYELNWDCNLENNAFLSNCDANAVPIPADYGSNTATINLGGKDCDVKTRSLEILKTWWNQVKAKDLSTDAKYDETDQKQFGIMAFGKTTGMACSYNKCSGGGKLLCLYNTKPAANNDKLYEYPGTTCESCPADSPCVASLCQPKTYTPVTTANPQPKCAHAGDDAMTYDMQVLAQDMHNYYRRLVGSGWAPDQKNYWPTAKQMTALKYDCDAVGVESKTIADDCNAKTYTAKNGYTLNSYVTQNFNLEPIDVLKEAIKTWGEQSKLVSVDKEVLYQNGVMTTAGSFAHMVLDGASNVGCSVKVCKPQGFSVAVCQYDTVISEGDPVYTVGKPCSGCSAKQLKCDNALGGGLCIN